MRAWPASLISVLFLALILPFAHVEVQASGENNDSPPAPKSALAVNNSRQNSSQTLWQPLVLITKGSKATASTTASVSTSDTASTAKFPKASKYATAVATNTTSTEPGKTGPLVVPVPCGAMKQRSWTVRGRSATHLHVRECLAPEVLQPATALVPESVVASEGESKTQPMSSPEPQAAKVSPSSESQQSESQKSESQRSETNQSEPQDANNQQTDSQQTDIQQTTRPQLDSQQTKPQQTDTQPAKDVSPVDSESATPNVASTPINAPIIVQGQTVPTNGEPITVNNQPVFISSGYVHVGTSSTPIPVAQVTPPAAQPIVAGTLTFQPASPSPAAQVAPSPFVVGGLTFTAAAQAELSTGSSTTADQPQARPVVVGGTMYAPVESTSESETSPAADKQPEQGDSEAAKSQEQPYNAVNTDHSAEEESSSQPTTPDTQPIIIAGKTYTPITTPATPVTPSPPQPTMFSIAGTVLTQNGPAIALSGTLISLGASAVIIGTSSIPFTSSPTTPTPTSVLRIGSQTLTALHSHDSNKSSPSSSSEEEEKISGFTLNDSTLLPGSPGITIIGTLYSLNIAGSLIIGGTSTIHLATNSPDSTNSALIADGQTFTPVGSTAALVSGTVLSIGGAAIMEHGTRISLAPNGLVVGSSTFAYATPAAVTSTAAPSSVGGSVSGGVGTGVFPGGSAASTVGAMPNATDGAYSYRSGAPGKRLTHGIMTLCFGTLVCLFVMMGLV